MIETIDSEALAKTVNDALARRDFSNPLNVMVQVNTSGEDGMCLFLIIRKLFQLKFTVIARLRQ